MSVPLIHPRGVQRPFQEQYSRYLDGHGWVNGATRWSHYCASCKEYWHTLSNLCGTTNEILIPEFPVPARPTRQSPWPVVSYPQPRAEQHRTGPPSRAITERPLGENPLPGFLQPPSILCEAEAHLRVQRRQTEEARADLMGLERRLASLHQRLLDSQLPYSGAHPRHSARTIYSSAGSAGSTVPTPVTRGTSVSQTPRQLQTDDLGSMSVPRRMWRLQNSVENIQQEMAQLREEQRENWNDALDRRLVVLPSATPGPWRDEAEEARERLRQERAEARFRRQEESLRTVWGDVGSEEYVSPVTQLFQRSWSEHNRHQEERRQQMRQQAYSPPSTTLHSTPIQIPRIPSAAAASSSPPPETYVNVARQQMRQQAYSPPSTTLHSTPIQIPRIPSAAAASSSPPPETYVNVARQYMDERLFQAREEQLQLQEQIRLQGEQHRQSLARRTAEMETVRNLGSGSGSGRRRHPGHHHHHRPLSPAPLPIVAHAGGLDAQPGRPPPLEPEDLRLDCACKVCFAQLADTLLTPCNHLVLCEWCADQIGVGESPAAVRWGASCPVCRVAVRARIKVFRG